MIVKYFVGEAEVQDKPIIAGTLYREERWINNELASSFDSIVQAASEQLEIVINKVSGALRNSSDFTKITCHELTNVTISGTLNVPDRMFAMPIRRSDDKLTLFGVSVVDGKFEAVLNFPTSGQYRYTNEEANIDLPEGTFTIAPVKIDVLRKVL
ncbi:hypothetical protein [Shewanella halifaxensis]|uniref:hypothetical protein n=1 Tax=Shewanella halifaxensis TaxID=271098 RepID=UPI000D5937E5|nr:hypothetical protein [Shewanella halifaxensis]